MGRTLEGLARVLGFGLLIGLMVPTLALLPGILVDRGFDGPTRVSAFPAALVVLDPLVWRCVRNSVIVASAVTVGSLALGTGLGLVLGRRRFWGRRPLGVLAIVPIAVGPIWVAPGVVAWFGGESSWEWLAARSFLGRPGDDWARWMALVWVGLVGATPMVILATRAGLTRINPTWADAARVVGAGRMRVWLDVTWPTLRPELARVASTIFALTLVEPAGPTILGLRRTLVVEMTDAAFRFDQPNRAATLAGIAVLISVAARRLLVRWGGPVFVPPIGRSDLEPEPRAGKRLGGFAALTLVVWVGLSLGPAANFAGRLVDEAWDHRPVTGATLRLVVATWATPEARTWAINSVVTASLAVGLDLILLACLAVGMRRSLRIFRSIPPMAMAVGALAIPSLLATWADRVGGSILAETLRGLRVELAPGRSPGVLLVVVLAAVRLPTLARASTGNQVEPTPAPTDAALLAGASAREARRVARNGVGIVAGRPILLVWAWAATDLASAWALTALDERRTLASASLHLVGSGDGPLDPRLLGLLVATSAIRLAALGVVAGSGRNRPGRLGDWFVGD